MKLKVGYADYEILGMGAVLADAETCYGLTQPDKQRIYVRADVPAQAQAAILVHEMIHAIWGVYAFPKKDLIEEDVCTHLEVPLTALFRDNPWLPKALAEAFHRNKPIVRLPKGHPT